MSNSKSARRISSIKEEIRTLALKRLRDPHSSKTTWFLGVVFRGSRYLDGVITARTAAGPPAELEQLAQTILQSKYYGEIRVILCDQTLLNGSPIDFQELFKRTEKPVVVIVDNNGSGKVPKEPFQRCDTTSGLLVRSGETCRLEANGRCILLHLAGISPEMAIELIRKTSREDVLPEAMKVAGMVASAFLEMLQTDQKV